MRKDLHTFGSSNLSPPTPAPSGPRRNGDGANGQLKIRHDVSINRTISSEHIKIGDIKMCATLLEQL